MLDGDPIQLIDLQIIIICNYLVLIPDFGTQDLKLWMLLRAIGGTKITGCALQSTLLQESYGMLVNP